MMMTTTTTTTPPFKRELRGRPMRKSKMADGRESPKQKCKKDAESFVRKGYDDDDEDDDNLDETEGANAELKLPEVIGVSLNLSKKKLREFPEVLLGRMTNVQYVYLEGNKLTALPQDFFQRLQLLKWLDLRNNNLTALPTAGLRNHPSLEVVLLQGNRIKNLPPELATIPSLKGLQIAGNPIANVPFKVIEGGFIEVLKYLKKILAEDEVILPVSETILVKPSTSRDFEGGVEESSDSEMRIWDLDKLSQWRHFMKKKSENLNLQATTENDRPILQQQPKISVSLRSQSKPPLRPQPFRCGLYNKNRHRPTASALRYMRMRRTRLGYRRKPITMAMIQEKAAREARKAQVRETLEKQARKIQRMRDKEVLKNWRDHAKMTRQQMKLLDNYQEYPSKYFASNTPFDVDPEFLKMLSRVDLYRSLKDYDNRSKRSKKPRARITPLDLERQMNEIIKKLQQLDTDDTVENNSPRSKHSHMCDKMFKIMDIQKTLKNLQTLNSSYNGIMPIIKPKPKN